MPTIYDTPCLYVNRLWLSLFLFMPTSHTGGCLLQNEPPPAPWDLLLALFPFHDPLDILRLFFKKDIISISTCFVSEKKSMHRESSFHKKMHIDLCPNTSHFGKPASACGWDGFSQNRTWLFVGCMLCFTMMRVWVEWEGEGKRNDLSTPLP